MRRFEELQPAELHERDVAASQFDLQPDAVLRGAEQHRLRLEPEPVLASRQHLFDDIARLIGVVAHRHQRRLLGGGALAPQVLRETLSRQTDDAVGRGEDSLRRAVVALQRHPPRRRVELRREVEDVAHRRAAETVDRLRVVADDGEATSVGLHRQQQARLQAVGVLVLVHQHVAEAAADCAREIGVGDHLCPVEQEVVVVEHRLRLLGLDVGEEQTLQLVLPLGAPREAPLQDLGELRLCVHHRRVDRKAGRFQRETLALRRQRQFVADEVHQVGRILAIVDGEGGVEPDVAGVLAQEARADAVEGARPGKAGAGEPGVARRKLRRNALHAPRHLVGGTAREGEQQDLPGVGAVREQVRDAMGEGVGLARPGAGDHQQRAGCVVRADAVGDRVALRLVESGQIVRQARLGRVGRGFAHRSPSPARASTAAGCGGR